MVVYHGPIRGGKTGSMTVDLAMQMINGRTVYTNYPIEFDYQAAGTGKIKHLSSLPLDPDDLLYIDQPATKKKYTGAVLGWDEGALSMPSRDFMAARNRVISQASLLRGKLEMSLYFTIQYLSMWEKNMRIQEDALIFCHDLSFKFRQLGRGHIISQSFQDISGRFTGEMYEESQNVYFQTLKLQPFFNIWDTKKMFSVVQSQLKIGDVRKTLKGSDFDKEEGTLDGEESHNWALVQHTLRELSATGQTRLPQSLIYQSLKNRGFTAKPKDMAVILLDLGASIGSNGFWNFENTIERREPALV